MAESQKKKKIPTVEDLIRDILWKYVFILFSFFRNVNGNTLKSASIFSRDLPNSYSIALKTQELLKFLIAGNEWKNAL